MASLTYQDLDAANNQASDSVELPLLTGPAPTGANATKLVPQVTLDSSTATIGSTVVAHIAVRNDGAAINANTVSISAFGAPALVEVLGISGTGWTCSRGWGSADCTYTGVGTLASSASLPELLASLRVGAQTGPMAVSASVWNAGTRPAIGTAELGVTGIPALGDGTLTFGGCTPYRADCNPTEWPAPSGPMGSRIQELSLADLRISNVPSLNHPAKLVWETAPRWSDTGRLAYREDDRNTGYQGYGVAVWTAMTALVGPVDSLQKNRFSSSSTAFQPPTCVSCVPSGFLPSASASFGPKDAITWVANATIYGAVFVGDTPSTPVAIANVPGLREVAWSPDGSRMIYSAGSSPSQLKLWVLPVASTKRSQG